MKTSQHINLKNKALELRRSGESLRGIALKLNISHEWARGLIGGEPRGEVKIVAKENPSSVLDDSLRLLANDFPEHCTRLRGRMRKTQFEFGKLLGVNGNPAVAVSRWESGKHVPQKKYLLHFMCLQKDFDSLVIAKRNGTNGKK